MLGRNQSYSFSSNVINHGEACRLSFDIISLETGYLNVNMSPSVVRRLFRCNKSCGLSECKNETWNGTQVMLM